MQARVRFDPVRRNPLRRSCVSRARNASESAIWFCPAQPSAEIVRVEGAKCRRECDLVLSAATLCRDRASRHREMQARVRFGSVRRNPLRRSDEFHARAYLGSWEMRTLVRGVAGELEDENWRLCSNECPSPARASHKSDRKECPRESVPREYLDMLTSAYVPLHLHTSAHLYHSLSLSLPTHLLTCASTVTPSHPLSPSLFLHIFSINILICIQSLGQVDVNYRLTRNCWQITCLARSRGSFTVFRGAIEEFEPGAASSDDVAVVFGALLEVSAARENISIKPQRIWSICV